jgi:hypothetical protein
MPACWSKHWISATSGPSSPSMTRSPVVVLLPADYLPPDRLYVQW